MNQNLKLAMLEEEIYTSERLKGINTNLSERLKTYGFNSLSEYFSAKKQYLWENWIPEIRRTDIGIVSQEVERAIKEKDYGVYIPTVEGVYAFYGVNGIDEELCRELNVRPVNMGYRGGIIIGSDEDFAIEIVMPRYLEISNKEIMDKMAEIISKYVDDVSIEGNDILINGEKVMGCADRTVNGVYAWAAQISFGEYSDYITKICQKTSNKRPSQINKELLNKNLLEEEVLKWLLKK